MLNKNKNILKGLSTKKHFEQVSFKLIVSDNNNSNTGYVIIYKIENKTFRWACAIEMPKKVILTGGVKTMYNVSVYSTEGFVENWPQLKKGRAGHGCGHYINTDEKVVSV